MIALSHAMVLAAGEGRRMRPLTEETPKPLLPLAGRTLLDHALDRVADAGIGEAVVNAHWLADQVAERIAARERPRCTLSQEEALLETGGGVVRALPRLGAAPFLVANGDAFWLDGPSPTIARLARAFDPAEMDALLLLVRTAQISADWNKALNAPEVRPRLIEAGLDIAGGTPEQFAAHMRSEVDAMMKLVKESGIPPVE